MLIGNGYKTFLNRMTSYKRRENLTKKEMDV